MVKALSGLLGAEQYIITRSGYILVRETWEIDDVLTGHLHVPNLVEQP